MFDSKKPTDGALEQLEWALERYLEEVVDPDNRQSTADNNDAAYRKVMNDCQAFQITLMEAQVDKIITPSQARLIAINLLLTSFETDNLRRTAAGFIVTSEEWAKLQREPGEASPVTEQTLTRLRS